MDALAQDRASFALEQPESGIEPGDALRARVHYLVSQHHSIVVQTQFADAKAAALMTLSGVAALRAPIPTTFSPLEIALCATLLFTVLLCLGAIMPRFGNRAPDGTDRFTWLALTRGNQSTQDSITFVRDGAFDDLIASIATSNLGGAKVLRKKFQLIRLAFICAIFAVLSVACIAVSHANWLGSFGLGP